jgi:chorismate synthase
MDANIFGRVLKFASFGESHGPAMGAVIFGMPAGVSFDEGLLVAELDRRRPGTSARTSARQEADKPEILSGLHEGLSLGTPIAVVVRNTDAKSTDYEPLELALAQGKVIRPGHADDLWRDKFGHSDVRGGGRASGRETLSRVIAGSMAQMFLKSQKQKVTVQAEIERVGPYTWAEAESMQLLETAREQGESWGGAIRVRLRGVPRGLGQPVFAKLKSEISEALLSIGASAGVYFGDDVEDFQKPGTVFHSKPSSYGGLRGGISTGDDIELRLWVKPPSTVGALARAGRHDPCILPRMLPVVEAMLYFVIADQLLLSRLDRC